MKGKRQTDIRGRRTQINSNPISSSATYLFHLSAPPYKHIAFFITPNRPDFTSNGATTSSTKPGERAAGSKERNKPRNRKKGMEKRKKQIAVTVDERRPSPSCTCKGRSCCCSWGCVRPRSYSLSSVWWQRLRSLFDFKYMKWKRNVICSYGWCHYFYFHVNSVSTGEPLLQIL